MGQFWQGIPNFLLNNILEALGDEVVAIESGTYKGYTARKLALFVDHVITIEADFNYYTKSKKALQRFRNVTVMCGDSRTLIGQVLPPSETKCVLWLDAHYSGGDTAGSQDHCPLMDELLQILPLRHSSNSIILIDDSRGLIGASGWPILSDVVGLLNQHDYSSIIIDDVLIASSTKTVNVFAKSFFRSRTHTFERLGGRMSLVLPLVRIIGFIASLGFKIKSIKFSKR